MIQLNKILKGFNKTITQLEQLISSNNRDVLKNDTQMEALRERNQQLLIESGQAVGVVSKLKALVGG